MLAQDEAIVFECAYDAVGHMIAIYSEVLYDEKKKLEPDFLCIVEIEKRIDELAREFRCLHVTDHEKIAFIRRDYGAQIRAHRVSNTNWDRT
jgi:hypothetical protein